ncbi:class I SAM-dependent DNA methyltransferase [Parahaliea mediterranea]|uniref:class I SAM-dependent DNA methyltransferase n=1 Tax=Parahaliea mediterranea TaxID=651086 RepID=UPI000E2F3FDC|nr:DNA methyltransferase [Parahaliea mediterranea]
MNLIRKELDLPAIEPQDVDSFIARWSKATGTEKANYQLFLTELCTLLHLPQPEPASEDTETNAYVFERRVDIANPDGTSNRGFIDLYRRESFVLEAKQSGKDLDSAGWDKAMLAAHNQADKYVRALPSTEGRPPFIVVTDVGRSIELYAEFTRTGGTYVPYPDPSSHRIKLEELAQPAIQDRLRRLWVAPDTLDTSKFAAEVTREVSYKLADLAKSLEASGYEVERIAHFLKRCLFTMFAEDVSLIPEYSFTTLLERLKGQPEVFADSMASLWNIMNTGGYEGQLMKKLPQFNGGLFTGVDPIPLDANQIQLLIDAAKADWRFVEPAIFGTLLERALDPRERHKLGAHYTPRAYVERLVMPTIIDPLREQWSVVQAAAEMLIQDSKPDKALAEVRKFHHALCEVKVLDPACGSGNFLYVALEHMKRLEGEVLNVISGLTAGQVGFETEGLTVDPHQFLGIEINPRAAAVAELVLWIGYLQWHYRIHGKLNIPEPILRDFHNIECRDALIEYDDRVPVVDDDGNPVTIWDGISYKESPVTGELVPDESGRTQVYEYVNPRKTEWPAADYIVGNPPFIGKSRIREALSDSYVDALRLVYKGEVTESADFVMYWWWIAAKKVASTSTLRFGLITTNSIKQPFNRRVVDKLLHDTKKPLSLLFAIPDHPWVDSLNGASVRIAMSVVGAGNLVGMLHALASEHALGVGEERGVSLTPSTGVIHSDFRIGANLASSAKLLSNSKLCSVGVMVHGSGFVLEKEASENLISEDGTELSPFIRPYLNGKDINQRSRNFVIIDLFGLADSTR